MEIGEVVTSQLRFLESIAISSKDFEGVVTLIDEHSRTWQMLDTLDVVY